MKHRKMRIIIILIIIICMIILIPLIRKRMLLYQVRDKFLGKVYDISRNGNYYTVYHYKMVGKDDIITSDVLTEIYAKDGESMRIYRFDNEDGTTSESIMLMKDGYEYNILGRSDGSVQGIYRPIQWFNKIDTNNAIGDLLLNVFHNGHFEKVEEGTYKGKDCYILTVGYDIDIKDTIYVNPETYLPSKMESVDSENGFYEEYEWLTLEVGNVKKLPEYDLDIIKENSVSALELENREQ